MKKIIAVLLSIALMLSCLPLAFGEDYLTGTIWTMTPESLENLLRASNGEEGAALAPYASVTLDFRVDGTLYTTLTAFSNSEKHTDSWSIFKSGKLRLTLLGGNPIITDYYFDNGCLCLDDGEIVLKFTAEEGASKSAAESGNPSTASSVDLSGKWDAKWFYKYIIVAAAAVGQDNTAVLSVLDVADFTLGLNKDGTATLSIGMYGSSKTRNFGKWSVSGNTFTFSNIPFDFILSGDTLTLFPALPPCDPFTMTRIK